MQKWNFLKWIGVAVVVLFIAVISYCVGYYEGCFRAIGANENMGAAISIRCPEAQATLGEILSRLND